MLRKFHRRRTASAPPSSPARGVERLASLFIVSFGAGSVCGAVAGGRRAGGRGGALRARGGDLVGGPSRRKKQAGHEAPGEAAKLQLERKAAEEASRREQAAAAAAAAEEPAAGAAPASSQRRLSFVVDPEALEPGDAVQYV